MVVTSKQAQPLILFQKVSIANFRSNRQKIGSRHIFLHNPNHLWEPSLETTGKANPDVTL